MQRTVIKFDGNLSLKSDGGEFRIYAKSDEVIVQILRLRPSLFFYLLGMIRKKKLVLNFIHQKKRDVLSPLIKIRYKNITLWKTTLN